MTARARCEATVRVCLGERCEDDELVRCELDAGHDDPRNEIGSRPVVPFHRWEDPELVLLPGGLTRPTDRQLTITVTWRTT